MTVRNETAANLPVLADGPRAPVGAEPRRSERRRSDAGFAAQLLGMEGQRRGLKGGAVVLAQARSAYLQAQWSGGGDRRLLAGRLTATRL